MYIFHITSAAEWSQAQLLGQYLPVDFAKDGFIHCSKKDQVLATAKRFYSGKTNLVLLKIDTDLLTSPIIEENLEGGLQKFPHLYGVLPTHAVVAFAPLTMDQFSNFVFPFE